ncbi:Ig-like domain-containing protein, partial [Terrimonas alba]|uniref:Ig-like domain-containing protein n=1 Tax=Terrimonas alba TaxID=3349636 RepID=UPI0035F35887
GATATALTATASGSNTLLWYTVATGGTGSATAPTPSTAAAGSTTYYVSQVTSLNCEGPRASITVTVNPTPAAPTVTSPVVYCQGATATALTATPAAGNTLLWYTVATGGTGSATAPTPSTAAAGSTTYYVSQVTSLNCEGPRAAITVTVNPTPAAPTVTSPVVYCQGETATALTATPAAGNTLLWYTVATGGTGSATAPTPSTAAAGSTTYYVSQVTSLNCEGPRAAITVTVNPTPAAPTVTSPVVYCQGATATALTATPAAGNTLLWYTVATGGTGSATAPTPSTAAAGSTTYYVSQVTSLNCEGPRVAITVTVNPTPAAPTVTSPVVYCQGATATALTATPAAGNTLLWYTVATGGTGSATAPTPSTAAAGSTTYYVSQVTSLNCEGPRAAITVTVNPTPAAPTVTTPVVYCQGATATALTATASGSNTLLWYTVATGGTGSATAPTPSTAAAGSTTYYVSQVTSL